MAREKRHFTCVVCPVGCEIDVEAENGAILSMEGNRCKKWEEFVQQELREPMRVLTTTVRVKDAKWPVLPVRTDKAVPRRLIPEIMKEVSRIEMEAPVRISDVAVADIAGTGADVVATRSMERVSR
ncbi:MAG: DUF1667 domain-containing protein [Dehalococcoidia bacterium]|nr:DUF1667 domain-containing protein [Dehalococcoidia bacterium]